MCKFWTHNRQSFVALWYFVVNRELLVLCWTVTVPVHTDLLRYPKGSLCVWWCLDFLLSFLFCFTFLYTFHLYSLKTWNVFNNISVAPKKCSGEYHHCLYSKRAEFQGWCVVVISLWRNCRKPSELRQLTGLLKPIAAWLIAKICG